jgi:predicted acetyltransferase
MKNFENYVQRFANYSRNWSSKQMEMENSEAAPQKWIEITRKDGDIPETNCGLLHDLCVVLLAERVIGVVVLNRKLNDAGPLYQLENWS